MRLLEKLLWCCSTAFVAGVLWQLTGLVDIIGTANAASLSAGIFLIAYGAVMAARV